MRLQRSARLPSRRRAALHALLVMLGWGAFFWFWAIVLGQVWGTFDLWVLIAASLLLLPAATIAWVMHNLALHQRKGPRQAVPAADVSYAKDFYGRRIEADWSALAGQREIAIDVDGPVKRYVAVGPAGRLAAAGAEHGSVHPATRPASANPPSLRSPAES